MMGVRPSCADRRRMYWKPALILVTVLLTGGGERCTTLLGLSLRLLCLPSCLPCLLLPILSLTAADDRFGCTGGADVAGVFSGGAGAVTGRCGVVPGGSCGGCCAGVGSDGGGISTGFSGRMHDLCFMASGGREFSDKLRWRPDHRWSLAANAML